MYWPIWADHCSKRFLAEAQQVVAMLGIRMSTVMTSGRQRASMAYKLWQILWTTRLGNVTLLNNPATKSTPIYPRWPGPEAGVLLWESCCGKAMPPSHYHILLLMLRETDLPICAQWNCGNSAAVLLCTMALHGAMDCLYCVQRWALSAQWCCM